MAYSLGRITDCHCPVEKKEGMAIEVQPDQVKEEGNVIGAEGEIKVRYFFFFQISFLFVCFFSLPLIKEKELGQ